MNQNSSRIALGAAFLLAAAGVAFYFVRADAAKVRSASLAAVAKGDALPALTAPVVPEHSLGWEKRSIAEGDLWSYDLFTPVEVRWNGKANQYEPKGLVAPPVVPFGIRLIALKHPTYRYRLSGLFEGDKPADSFINLLDLNTKRSVNGKLGQTVGPADRKITLVRYENKPVKQSDGSIRRDTFVVVKDATLGREIKVTRDPIEFTDKIIATFAVQSGSDDIVWTASAVGDKFDNDAGSFVIKGIDFNAQSVTVEKSLPDDTAKKVVEALSPAPTPAPVAPPAPAVKK